MYFTDSKYLCNLTKYLNPIKLTTCMQANTLPESPRQSQVGKHTISLFYVNMFEML